MASALSAGSSAVTRSRRRSQAVLPPSCSMTLPCDAVTVHACPTGRQPWDTTVARSTPGGSNRPTAPRAREEAPEINRLAPAPRPADANPPTTCRWG